MLFFVDYLIDMYICTYNNNMVLEMSEQSCARSAVTLIQFSFLTVMVFDSAFDYPIFGLCAILSIRNK